MIHKGNYIEVLADVLPDKALSLEGLMYYHRSHSLKMVVSGKRHEPYMSLKDVEPKPLWKFPGHPSINRDWFNQLLLFDTGQYELKVEADLVRRADDKKKGDDFVRYLSGIFIVRPRTELIVGEAGIVWSEDTTVVVDQTLLGWPFVRSFRAVATSP